MTQRTVFVLQHSYGDESHEDTKLVGVYSSHEEAESAIKRRLEYPGFQDHPDGFSIDEYELNKDAWSEGFGVRSA